MTAGDSGGGGEAAAPPPDATAALYDRSPFGYVSTATDWTILRANRTLLDLIGRTEDDVVGRRLPDLLAPGDRIFHETHYAPLVRLQGSVREVAADLVGADGALHPVLLHSDMVADDGGGDAVILTGVVHVRSRRRYEDELRHQRHRAEASEARERVLREALAALAVALTADDVARVLQDVAADVVAGDATVWLLSPGGEALVPVGDGGGGSTAGVPADGDGIEAAALRAVGAVEDAEGHRVAVGLRAGGDPLGVLVVDRAEQGPRSEHEHDLLVSLGQQAGQALERARLYEDKDRMLRMVAHDLRTPLATIGGFAQTLQRFVGEDLQPAAAQSLERIVSTTERLTRLTDDLLDAAVLEVGQFSLDRARVPVGPVVVRAATAHEPLAAEKSIPLHLRDGSAGATAAIDADRLVQVVDNLVSNALKYSPPGRPVTVTVTAEPDHVRVDVADRGPGIPRADLPHLFTAFGRTRNRPTGGESSTGLGLAIAHGIVEAHGGDLGVETSEGEGSTFSFWVPREVADDADPGS